VIDCRAAAFRPSYLVKDHAQDHIIIAIRCLEESKMPVNNWTLQVVKQSEECRLSQSPARKSNGLIMKPDQEVQITASPNDNLRESILCHQALRRLANAEAPLIRHTNFATDQIPCGIPQSRAVDDRSALPTGVPRYIQETPN
jgi:hypothetical protein